MVDNFTNEKVKIALAVEFAWTRDCVSVYSGSRDDQTLKQ